MTTFLKRVVKPLCLKSCNLFILLYLINIYNIKLDGEVAEHLTQVLKILPKRNQYLYDLNIPISKRSVLDNDF